MPGRMPVVALPCGRREVVVLFADARAGACERPDLDAGFVVHVVTPPREVVIEADAFGKDAAGSGGAGQGLVAWRDGVSGAGAGLAPGGRTGAHEDVTAVDAGVGRVLAEVLSAAREQRAAALASAATGMSTADLPDAVPDVRLVRFLAGLELGDLGDGELVEVAAAWRRVASWAEANTAFAAGELGGRASMNPPWPVSAGDVSRRSVAGDELAMALACSPQAGNDLADMGRVFREHLGPTGQALARGEIDVLKARQIVRTLVTEHPVTAWDVQERVLAGAGSRTPSQFERDVQRALIAVDPEGASERARSAQDGRRVCKPRPRADGMAGMWALLPAVTAVQIDAALDVGARSARAGGDGRTIDQLRADLFADHLLGGAGPGGAVLVDPRSLPDAHPGPGPGATDEAAESEAAVDDEGMSGEAVDGDDPGEALGARRRPRTARQVVVNVSVPFDVLLGISEAGGEIEGFGPIPAEAARLIAADATWRRIVTDPLSGTVLDVGRTRYRPPRALGEHVRARDRRCARPGCSAPARTCDLDHTIEFRRADGTTAHSNLGPLCPRDHQIKTDGGFEVSQTEPGVFVWRTPTGHVYRVRPGADQGYEVLSTGVVPHEPTWEERRIARRPRYVDLDDVPADWPSDDTSSAQARARAVQAEPTPDPWPDTPPY